MSILKVDTINEKTTGNGVYIPNHVVQVEQVVVDANLGPYTTSTWVTESDFDISITPTSNTSKVLITGNIMYGQGASTGTDDFTFNIRLLRNGTPLSYTVNSGRGYGEYAVYKNHYDNLSMEQASFSRLDTPSSTSAVTYSVQIATGFGGWASNPVYINRAYRFDDAWYAQSNARSTITLMEIAQ
jgi:hypothetical protein